MGWVFLTGVSALAVEDAVPAYKNRNLPVDERVKDLIGRMTLEEKARQLDMYNGCEDLVGKKQTIDNHTHAKPDAVFDPQFAEKNLGNLGAGSIHDLYPKAKLYNTIQAWVIKSSRLGIPALFIGEGLHGYMSYDQTVFPQSINLATTWNLELARKTGAPIAAEARAAGVDMPSTNKNVRTASCCSVVNASVTGDSVARWHFGDRTNKRQPWCGSEIETRL